jgi:hypothetical protein
MQCDLPLMKNLRHKGDPGKKFGLYYGQISNTAKYLSPRNGYFGLVRKGNVSDVGMM